jgi:hypothetical protein
MQMVTGGGKPSGVSEIGEPCGTCLFILGIIRTDDNVYIQGSSEVALKHSDHLRAASQIASLDP